MAVVSCLISSPSLSWAMLASGRSRTKSWWMMVVRRRPVRVCVHAKDVRLRVDNGFLLVLHRGERQANEVMVKVAE